MAFLDILGYRQLLKEMSTRLLEHAGTARHGPEIGDATARVIRVRRQLIGNIQMFYKAMAEIPTRNMEGLPPELDAIKKSWSQMRVRRAHYSDSIVMYLNLGDESEHDLKMGHLHNMLIGCCGAQLLQLASGAEDVRETLPLRGAIDVDMGTEIADPLNGKILSKDEEKDHPDLMQFYSAALATAYEMEQEEAVYPRVIVSAQFLTMLSTHITDRSGSDLRSHANRRYAEMTGGLLAQDGDGAWFVDFMGTRFREISKDERYRGLAEQAWKYVKEAYRLHRSSKNRRVAQKYLWLRDYMVSRLPLWGVPE